MLRHTRNSVCCIALLGYNKSAAVPANFVVLQRMVRASASDGLKAAGLQSSESA